MKLRTLFSIILIFTLLGCSKQESVEQQSPSARSSYAMSQVDKDAAAWKALDPDNRVIGEAEPTGSMLRVFDSTSVVLLEKVKPTDVVNIGDILVYKNKTVGKNITHRYVRNESGKLVLKGDNLSNEDPSPIDRSEVTYRVVGVLYTSGK